MACRHVGGYDRSAQDKSLFGEILFFCGTSQTVIEATDTMSMAEIENIFQFLLTPKKKYAILPMSLPKPYRQCGGHDILRHKNILKETQT